MTITVIQEAFAQAATAVTTVSVVLTGVTTGSSIHVITQTNSGNNITGVSDGVNTYTTVGGNITLALGFIARNRVANSVTGGTLTITVTISSAQSQLAIIAREIGGTSGIDTAGITIPPGQAQVNPGTATDAVTTGLVFTPTTQPGLVSAYAFTEDTGLSAGTGYTAGQLGSFTNMGGNFRTEQLRYTTTTNFAATFTKGAGTADTIALGVLFFEAAAPGDQFLGQAFM